MKVLYSQSIQANETDNDDVDQTLMIKRGSISPPAILFFDWQSNELKSYLLLGYFEAGVFAERLVKVLGY